MTAKDNARGAARSKTMWFALALSVAGVVQLNLDVFSAWLTPEMQGLATLGVGIAVAVLRWITTDPLSEK